MWLVTLRDLQWRRRRFAVAVAATALVFAMTLLLSGTTSSLHAQDRRIVTTLGADRWFVAEGSSGPFTASRLLPVSAARRVAAQPGVDRTGLLVIARSTAGTGTPKDVNLIGYEPGGIGAPPVSEGRVARKAGEAVADSHLNVGPGDQLVVGGREFRVVGVSNRVTFYFGTPTVLLTLPDAQQVAFAGQPYVSAVAAAGTPKVAPDGMRMLTNAAVRADLKRPTKSGDQTIVFLDALLWIVAAGIIGSIVYLSAIERTRDFAVLKATGASTRSLLGGLAVQAVILSGAAAVVAALLAQLLAPSFPFDVSIPPSAYVLLLAVAVVVGLVSSLLGLRRSVRVDPALAFGGA